MDRIEFIEELQSKIKEQTKVRDTLELAKTKAYNNSIYRLRDDLASIETDQNSLVIGSSLTMTSNNYGIWATETRQPEPTSTRTIIELGHTLVELENECDNLENDIAKYNSKSIIDHIPDLKDLVDGNK